jgi:hypothetical protein
MRADADFFLDVLSLVIYTDDKEIRDLVAAMLKYHKEKYADVSDPEKDLIKTYVDFIQDIVFNGINIHNPSERSALFVKLNKAVVLQDKPEALEKLTNCVLNGLDGVNGKRVEYLAHKIRNWLIQQRSNLMLRQMLVKSNQCAVKSELVEQDILIDEIITNARKICSVVEELPGRSTTVDFINMSDPVSVRRALTTEIKNKKNPFKLGLQSLEKLFGDDKVALTRGNMIGFGAKSHDFKSSMMIKFARWFATYNAPENPASKAAIVFISVENDVTKNLRKWFKELYIELFNREPDDDMPIEDIVQYVNKEFSKNGFDLLVFREDESLFGYNEFVALHHRIKEMGYEVHATILDYLGRIRIDEGADNPAKIRQLMAAKFHGWANQENVLLVTALQLNNEADIIAAGGGSYCVKKFGPAHLADCKGMFREFDWFGFMFLEDTPSSARYLTIMLRKDRYQDPPVPLNQKFVAWRFSKQGIMDDIDKLDSSVQDIYAHDQSESMKSKESEYSDIELLIAA